MQPTMQPSSYTISILTKSYIRHFLVSVYGNPVDFRSNRDLYSNLRRRLNKKCLRFEKRGLSPRIYTDLVEIVISEDDFYRFGWELSITDIISINRDIESQVKFFMRNMVSTYETVMQQNEAILLFQERFGYNDDIWNYEAIKKDYWRNTSKSEKIKLLPKFSINLEKIVLEHLSELGTFMQPIQINHENHLKEL